LLPKTPKPQSNIYLIYIIYNKKIIWETRNPKRSSKKILKTKSAITKLKPGPSIMQLNSPYLQIMT